MRIPAGKIIAVGLVCFALWTLLEATSLERSSEAGRLGTRRSAALALLHPLATFSRMTGLDRLREAVDSALGRKDESAAPASPAPRGLPAADLPVTSSDPPTPSPSSSPMPSPEQPAIVPTVRVPTPDRPLRVLVIGDSLGEDLGNGLARTLASSGLYDVTIDTQISTGLSRRDYFDWPARLRSDLARIEPDVVVVMLGANDPQDFLVRGSRVVVGTTAWSAAYRDRVGRFMDQVLGQRRALVWVGMPAMRSDRLSGWMRALDRFYRAEAAERGVVYVDPWPLSTDGHGHYAPYLPDPAGDQELVREPDGVHFTAQGSDRLAEAVIANMRSMWAIPR